MTDDLVEKVARAMVQCIVDNPQRDKSLTEVERQEAIERMWRYYIDLARAAIAAFAEHLREMDLDLAFELNAALAKRRERK